MKDIFEAIEQMEPKAAASKAAINRDEEAREIILTSIAISLKRIADMMDYDMRRKYPHG